ncbi:glycosyltransferase family 2 protein [Brevundimonas subvibrioides]|uniref:Glycosyl transferase family 2 n=1 Tax=Brevundimonas subvibrioides (strain ATCC 15264 / DSM 4735 / LMG 14903 / NBRC 16000 / CB 81) TaxID=633149 RepID=D9QKW0_BRESC|nr:glycosyltransferase [Brevundimonas subvibrioides]ADL01774.1 glycosyl transferase family 2 [Brevundimonas subvibrioides ATCC 15264]
MTRPPSPGSVLTDNARRQAARPAVSVLIPFLRDDPTELLGLLDEEAGALDGAVEIVLLDDGTGDAELTARLQAVVHAMSLPVRLISLTVNEGRSQGRNRLAASARGGSLLFLDSDMRPDHRRFLWTWADLVAREDPAVAFGGFSLLQAPTDARFSVHRAMATRSDCVPYGERARTPEKYVYTSNLLVRRDVFEAEAFDPAFTGWGWEDVEWAMRVSRRFTVVHVDNPATHMGLDTVEALAGKYEQSAGNFARVVARHPDIVGTYPSFKAARLLKRVPALSRVRPWIKQAAVAGWMPTGARAFSLRLYRAALYAEAV